VWGAEQLDQRIAGLIRAIKEHLRRRTFLLGFSSDPVGTFNAFIASQARELRIAEGAMGPRALTRTDVFHGKWVEDAVVRYLHRRVASGT
jgi:SWI/SNF-related matrix-associated actin-dependent regulator of chromatin subfamily D